MFSKGQATSLAKMATRAMSSSSSSATPWAPPLNLPTAQEEDAAFKGRTAQVKEFFESPRFKDIKRPYSAEVVATKQGNLPALPLPSSLLADKLHALLTKAAEEKKPVHTMGAIDPVQMTQMARHQQVVYVSGWVASSVLTTANNEVGPDLACVFCAGHGYALISPLMEYSLGTTRIRRCQTRCIGSSVHSSTMTGRFTMSACPPRQINGPRWKTLTTCGLSSRTETRDTAAYHQS